MKIFGREPATILAFIAVVLKLTSAYGLGVTDSQQALIMAVLSCIVAVATAVILKTGAAFAALVNLAQAALALFVGFGLHISAQQQSLWMSVVEGVIALIVVRPQVTAPISSLRVEQSSLVKAA